MGETEGGVVCEIESVYFSSLPSPSSGVPAFPLHPCLPCTPSLSLSSSHLLALPLFMPPQHVHRSLSLSDGAPHSVASRNSTSSGTQARLPLTATRHVQRDWRRRRRRRRRRKVYSRQEEEREGGEWYCILSKGTDIENDAFCYGMGPMIASTLFLATVPVFQPLVRSDKRVRWE